MLGGPIAILHINLKGYIVTEAWFVGNRFNYRLGDGAYVASCAFLIFGIVVLLSLFLGMVAAVIFQPLRTGTLSIIEKLYFGKRLDHYRSLKKFSEGLTTMVELDLLGESTVKKLASTFKLVAGMGIPAGAATGHRLWLGRNTPAAKRIARGGGALRPVRHRASRDPLRPVLGRA